jgi:hypothetical protein
MPRRTPFADVGKRSIPDFLPITWAVNVQMDHARPFWTSTLQEISIDIKNTLMRGVLTPTIQP